MVKVSVKWTKETYDVECNPSEGFDSFQALLFSLTFVPPARQKLMHKGRILKDVSALEKLKEGEKLMLMGSAEPPPKEPEKQIIFEEDLTEAQKIGVVKDLLSAGLHNLGNTCYMASTLQCLRAVPELKQALIKQSQGAGPSVHDPDAAVVRQLGALYKDMDSQVSPVTPLMFTTVFRSTFPQFAETGPEGRWMQQDAEEALIQLMNSMASVLKQEHIGTGSGGLQGSSRENNLIDTYFGGQMETRTYVKGQSPDSADAKVVTETYRRLKCFIGQDTNYLFQGLKSSLVEEVELRGQILERSSTLLTLPQYLIVQMMRFDWRRDTQKKSKKLRKVDFPLQLDVLEFAHPSLKHQLSAARNLLKEEQDEKLGLKSLNKKMKTDANQTAGSSPKPEDEAMEVDTASASSSSSSSSPSVLTTPTSGQYELFALVTHKGRTSDSGHYVSWCKQSDSGEWLKFDDDKVSKVSEDEVKLLSGGGDRDMAYLLFYRRIDDVVKFAGKTIPEPKAAAATNNSEDKKESSAQPAAAAASSSN